MNKPFLPVALSPSKHRSLAEKGDNRRRVGMKLGNKPKLALHITLWALAGVALLALPALLSSNATKSTEAPLFGRTVAPTTATPQSFQPSANPSALPQQPATDNRDFFVRLILILVPAAAFSGFVKNRTDKRMRNAWI